MSNWYPKDREQWALWALAANDIANSILAQYSGPAAEAAKYNLDRAQHNVAAAAQKEAERKAREKEKKAMPLKIGSAVLGPVGAAIGGPAGVALGALGAGVNAYTGSGGDAVSALGQPMDTAQLGKKSMAQPKSRKPTGKLGDSFAAGKVVVGYNPETGEPIFKDEELG